MGMSFLHLLCVALHCLLLLLLLPSFALCAFCYLLFSSVAVCRFLLPSAVAFVSCSYCCLLPSVCLLSLLPYLFCSPILRPRVPSFSGLLVCAFCCLYIAFYCRLLLFALLAFSCFCCLLLPLLPLCLCFGARAAGVVVQVAHDVVASLPIPGPKNSWNPSVSKRDVSDKFSQLPVSSDFFGKGTDSCQLAAQAQRPFTEAARHRLRPLTHACLLAIPPVVSAVTSAGGNANFCFVKKLASGAAGGDRRCERKSTWKRRAWDLESVRRAKNASPFVLYLVDFK
jgi:hypothetical protein